MPQPVNAPETFEWKKQFLRSRWKLVREGGETVAIISLSWITELKGEGTYDGRTFVVYEQGLPNWGTYLKWEGDTEYWGRFEGSDEKGGTRFVLRNLKQYRIVKSGRRCYDFVDHNGNVLATTKFSLMAFKRSYFTLLRLDPQGPEPSMLAIVSLIDAYKDSLGNLILAFGTGATSGV